VILATGKQARERATQAFRWTTTCATRESLMVAMRSRILQLRLPALGQLNSDQSEQWQDREDNLAAWIHVMILGEMRNEIRIPRAIR
jgi:hypothetical protein